MSVRQTRVIMVVLVMTLWTHSTVHVMKQVVSLGKIVKVTIISDIKEIINYCIYQQKVG